MKNKKSLKEMSKVPLIKYSKADHRNQVATVLLHLKTNHKHSLPQLIDDLSLSLEMLVDNKNSLALPNNDQHQLLRTRRPPQIMAPIKLLIVVNSMVLMQSQRREERN